ncbi:retrovirus-related pol polyprotein from transposon TNT 1-94, partial [Tanacetum coccineum]
MHPSLSNSSITRETQTPILSHDVEKDNHDIEVAHMGNDPYFAFAAHMNMVVYQMDVKTAFLNGNLREELHARGMICCVFIPEIQLTSSKGSEDPTLFIRRTGMELTTVQIYVDDIIFVASTPELCDLFAKIMCSKFKMSMMGKISFFLGLQISQSPRGIFINQSKYALESLKKYGFESCDPVDTPMVEKSKLDEDKEGKAVDPSHYHGSAYRKALKCAFADADHAGCQDTRRSTSGSIQLLGDRLVSWSSKRQKSAAISSTEAEYIALSGLEQRQHSSSNAHRHQISLLKSCLKWCDRKLYLVIRRLNWRTSSLRALGRERIEFLINKLERISKKRTKNEAKTTKPDTEWKSMPKMGQNDK